MERREFLGSVGTIAAALPLRVRENTMPGLFSPAPGDRDQWVASLTRLATPVLTALAQDRLKESMPVEERPPQGGESRRAYAHLEAFGRLMSGMTPWLALPDDGSAEGKDRERFADLARRSLANAVNPKAKDFMNFSSGAQPLVDGAFLALAFTRAPGFWEGIEPQVRRNVIGALRSTRVIRPYFNNWLLFSGMIEAFFCSIGEEYDQMRVDYALRQHEQWYKGDGIFGDGPDFHWDYYNSYVIQPFLRTILGVLAPRDRSYAPFAEKCEKIAGRYAVIQERLIGSDGTFPLIGRSLAYRCGAFHHLASETLLERLPDSLSPGQVRSGLWAVIDRTLSDRRNYDADGWLAIGLSGHQPQIGEGYISTGSLYLAATAFLPLGLPKENLFWTSPAAEWTALRAWKGEDIGADAALKQ
jgi:hypothetical protein